MATPMDTSPRSPAPPEGAPQPLLVARRHVCEYGLMPVQSLLPRMDGPQAVLALASRLTERSSADPSGTNRVISSTDVAAVLGLPCEGTTKIILDTLESVGLPGSVSQDESQVSLHALILLLFVQLHSRQGTLAKSTEVWPNPRDLECHEAPLSPTRGSSSPRTAKSTGGKKGKHQQNRKWFQEQLQHHTQHLTSYPTFIRRHVRHLLLLMLNSLPAALDPPPGDLTVNAAEVDRLGMLLQPRASEKALVALSTLVPGLQGGGNAPFAAVEKWLMANTAAAEAETGHQEPLRAGTGSGTITTRPEGLVDLQGILKGTVVRGDDLCPGGELRIADCHDVVIYALTPLKNASIFGCSDATIVIGAVGQLLRIERCERLQLIVAARHVTISTCHDCTLHLAVNKPPLFIGDNRFIQLAPYCTQYEQLELHLQAAGVSRDVNAWDQPVTVSRNGIQRLSQTPDSPSRAQGPMTDGGRMTSQWTLLPPSKLLPFVIPFKGSGGSLGGSSGAESGTLGMAPFTSTAVNPFPLPAEYEEALNTKVQGVASLRSAVKSAVLDEPRKRELQAVIQAHFKEWLVASGNMRQIYDLARLEREEGM